MRYVGQFGTPNSMDHPLTKHRIIEGDKPMRLVTWARRKLTECEPYCRRFEPTAADRLVSAKDEMSSITIGDWAQSSRQQPLRWTIDVGWTKVCVEMWKEG